MKKFCLCVCRVAALLLGGAAMAQWENALAPQGIPVEWPAAEARTIVLTAEATPQERFAAQLLQNAVRKMTGVEWPVAAEAPAGRGIYLGTEDALAPDGYRLREENGDWHFTGGVRRGPVNAVLAFLEEDLGWRHYTIFGTESFPDLRGKKLHVVPRAYNPPLEVREVHIREAWDPDWVLLNRAAPMFDPIGPQVNRDAGGVRHYPVGGWFAHSFARLAPDSALLAGHPEYFAEINGVRQAGNICLSNPETLKIVVANALKILDAQPDADLFGISQNDGDNVICTCQECRAVAEAEGGNCGPLLNFVNRAAELIARKYPDCKISTLAYMETYQRPKTIRPAKNVVVFLATDRHAWNNPFHYVDETDGFRRALAEWNDTGAEIHIWDYVFGDNQHWLNPSPNFDAVAYNLRFYLRNENVTGMLLQDNYCSTGDSRGALKNWLMTKLMWNPDWDVRALERDFCFGYYGAAGEYMQQYNELLRREWERYHGSVRPANRTGFTVGPGFHAEAKALLTQALQAVAGDAFLTREVEREMLCLDYQELNSGRRNDESIAAYLARLETFRAKCAELGIESFAEAQAPSSKFAAWKFGQLRQEQTVEYPGTQLYWLDSPRLYDLGTTSARIVDDALVPGGFAIFQPPSRDWTVQWPTGGDFGFETKYMLRIRVRAGKIHRTDGTALCFGLHPDFNCDVPASALSEDEYRWVESGQWVKRPAGQNIYICQPESGVTDGIYIERAEFVPEPEWQKAHSK